MIVKKCIFCGVALGPPGANKPDSKTKEHIYAKWYRDEVVNKEIKMFTVYEGKTPELQRKPSLEKLVNTAVCKECNNGWMSALEVAVDPIIDAIVKGLDIRDLTPQEIETLARWTAKAATTLSYVIPGPMRVPRSSSMSIHPESGQSPQYRVFYGQIKANKALEGGYLYLIYGKEMPLVNSSEVTGIRIALCVYNNMLTVDFPPMLYGLSYDLSKSCCAQIWPTAIPSGTSDLGIGPDATVQAVMLTICKAIQPMYDLRDLR